MYRRNVTDKQQADVENAQFDSAMPFFWMNSQTGVPETKALKAYDLQQQRDASAKAPAQNNALVGPKIIGSHNDKSYRFENPGKA